MHNDQKYIIYLQEHNSEGINKIYEKYAPMVRRMIKANSGTEDEAADIFQESLIDIFKLSLKSDFELTCSFEAFLIIVCKRKWLTELKSGRKKKVTNVGDDLYTYEKADAHAEDQALQIEKENTVLSFVDQLDEKCKKIIQACLKEKRQKKVAAQLGMSYAYLRKRKSICMSRLSDKVKDNPLFKT